MDRRTHADEGRVVPVRACRTFAISYAFLTPCNLMEAAWLELGYAPRWLERGCALGCLELRCAAWAYA